ncbi:hypothetical protein ACP4OV_002115 [Aristida adscensionis]
MELVVGASEATMNSLLGKLGGLLAQEYALIRGVRGDIQYISDELASMQAFLLDIARDDCQDNRKKDWMKQIRDMAYDCEDCVDNFAHRLPNDDGSGRWCWPWMATLLYDLWTWRHRREIASDIAELKVRAQLIAERRIRYGVENPKTEGDKQDPTEAPATYDIAEHQLASRELIGIKEPIGMMADMERLEEWVKGPIDERAVVSIVGFGGVGKTTIAMALYRKVMNEFECRASVTVSQNYDRGAVLGDILKQIQPRPQDDGAPASMKRAQSMNRALQRDGGGDGNAGSSSNTKLQAAEAKGQKKLEDAIKTLLDKKRYIILVDDIWSAETWNNISRCLPDDNKRCSRVIVTSRFHAVGATCCPRDKDLLYPIGFLSDVHSMDLFNQSVSESRSSKHSNNVHNYIPENLWKRCGGQPLAIVTMAGLVACNQNQPKIFWDKLCKSLPENVTSTDGAPEQVNSLTLDGVRRILDCCYNNLLGELKTCLLYLSIFPKGWKISRKCLTRRWIAEGFVSEKQGLKEEEVAETYFNQLLRRKLIRPVEHSSNGKLKTFQVHDMVLEYIASKAREENFITVVGGHLMMPGASNKVRRLSMQTISSKHGDSTKGMNLSQVRSLTVFGSLTQLPFEAFNKRIIQVLDFHGLKGLKNKHLDYICKMLVLKYLSLRGTDISEIPSAIGKLEYLQTLDIRETNITELPKAVEQLKLISSILGGSKNPRRGLRLPQEKSKKQQKSTSTQEKEKGGMKALRILSGIEIDETTAIAGLHQLTGLKKLTIYKLNILQKDKSQIFTQLLSSIEYLCSCGLETLAINDEHSYFINSLDDMPAPPRYLIALELSGKLKRPPKWITKLHALNRLTISATVLRTDTFELLRALPFLFSVTFSLSDAAKQDDIRSILEENKSQSDGEIFVPGEGFKSLKLLRIFAPRVPKLGFSHNAMPALEMIEMRFEAFEGLFGIDTLENLKGVYVHLREAIMEKKSHDTEINELLVADLKDNAEGLNVIVDRSIIS